MLVVQRNQNFINWSIGDLVKPLKFSGEVVVVFDPSKTNMAMLVGTPEGDILDTIEFSGNNRKRGPVMDTTLYCNEVRRFLSIYLSEVKLYLVGVEQAITKQGVNYHHSNMVLTEIRSNILNFFLEEFGMKVIEVNNWSWKHGILPEGYRSKYEKGSKKYFQQNLPTSTFTYYYEADMTDCICIYWYLVKTKCSNYSCYCNQFEKCTTDYLYYFAPIDTVVNSNLREMTYNPRFSIKENLDYYVNRVLGEFCMIVDVDNIDFIDIYGKSVGFKFSDTNCLRVKVVARRL